MSPRPRVPPPPLDVEAILGTLDRHGAEYVLIGGLAAQARLRGAEDVEFPLDDRSLASTEILTMTSHAAWLDVCRRPAGEQSYETLVPNAETYELLGLRVRVASIDDLIRSKTAAGRDKDLQGLPALRELKRRRG